MTSTRTALTLQDMGWTAATAAELTDQFNGGEAGYREVKAPFTNSYLYALPLSSDHAVDEAVARARSSQLRWAATKITERIDVMLRFHDLLLRHREDVLDIIQFETGKARRDALEELLDVCVVTQYYARTAKRLLADRAHRGAIPVLTSVREVHHPIGVVGVIAPWNYPLSLALSDAVPAMLAGNAVVVKPDVQTSLTAGWCRRLLREAGLPANVYQLVTGDGPTVGARLIDQVDHVMFTGSSATGRIVAARCGERLISATMELGGKNALIVRADAQVGRAARIAERAVFANSGQLCIAMERIYVDRKLFEPFVEQLRNRVAALKIGTRPGWGSDLGPLINDTHLDRVSGQVEQALTAGATVVSGGQRRPEIGPLVYLPTLLTDVTVGMDLCGQETFGPVASIYVTSDDDHAIQLANDTEYGLNASIVTADVGRGKALARRLNSGSVNINDGYAAAWGSVAAPLGGRGASGLGARHGVAGLLNYTESQTIATQRIWGFSAPAGISDRRWADLLARSVRIMRPLGHRSKGAS